MNVNTVVEFLKTTKSPVRAKELLGRSRKAQVISARHAWWYFLCHRKGFSKEKIAKAARRDRRSVYYGLRHAQNMLDTGDAFFTCYRDFLLRECENNS